MDIMTPEFRDKFDMDNYDEDDGSTSKGIAHVKALSGSILDRDLSYLGAPDPSQDPFITAEDRDDDELDDLTIRKSDLIFLSGVTEEDEFRHLDVQIYEEEDANLYTHHDLMLSAFPLCLEWIGFAMRTPEGGVDGVAERTNGNMVAIGTFDPHIEIWDLDTMDAMEPLMVLGSGPDIMNVAKRAKKDKENKKKKKKAK